MPPMYTIPDSKVHVANMMPTRVLSAPGGPHVGPMNLACYQGIKSVTYLNFDTWNHFC